ncbi:MAG: malate/L-lactate dehydrogenase [uncultured archaeon A07HR60]|nr:MAG: malate/L-lactate dehydrogenase [uncultured archaeon A07HR60]
MPTIEPERLTEAATAILEGMGTPPAQAATVAASLVDADLSGHGSHGTIRLSSSYAGMVSSGHIEPAQTPTVTAVDGSTVQVDGRRGFGQLTGREAVDVGIETAAEHGVSVVGIRNGSHLGRIGEWAARAADHGMIFVALVNTGLATKTVTVPGSAERLLSTNPIGFGIPGFDALEFPVVVDQATSQVAHGKITARSVDKDEVPPGWTIDDNGEPVRDAGQFEDGVGAILPLGGTNTGHKGFGLAVAMELIAGILGGSRVFGQGESGNVNNGAAFFVVDPLVFTDRETAGSRVAALAEHLRAADHSTAVPTPDSMKGDKLLLPGEPEHMTAQERRDTGIPVSVERIAAMQDTAAELGVRARLNLE